MKKKYQYLIPILNIKDKYTALNARSIKEVNKVLPDDNLVTEHIVAQSVWVKKGHKYQPIEIGIKQSEFDEIVREIKKKVKCKKGKFEQLNIHFDLETIPMMIIKIRKDG